MFGLENILGMFLGFKIIFFQILFYFVINKKYFQDHFQAVTDEIRGCDRCYHRFYRLGQIKPELFKVRKKRGKPAKNEKTSSTPSTGGLLLETGELGQRILDLSLQIHESPKINGKKKNKILEDGYLAINGCEQHLENLKNTIEEALIQRVCFYCFLFDFRLVPPSFMSFFYR